MRNSKLYIKDILEAIFAIERFVENVEFEDFKNNDEKSSAVIRKFEIIGEASKNVPDTIKQNYSDIPWREIAGFRDKLIHFYFGVKFELLWDTIIKRIPKLKLSFQQIFDDLEKES